MWLDSLHCAGLWDSLIIIQNEDDGWFFGSGATKSRAKITEGELQSRRDYRVDCAHLLVRGDRGPECAGGFDACDHAKRGSERSGCGDAGAGPIGFTSGEG
jgi:hypothetical protein